MNICMHLYRDFFFLVCAYVTQFNGYAKAVMKLSCVALPQAIMK